MDMCTGCDVGIELVNQAEMLRCFYCMGPLCTLCWEETKGGPCTMCRRAAELSADWGRRMSSLRRTHAGRKKRMRLCPSCRKRFGTRELRIHRRSCQPAPA